MPASISRAFSPPGNSVKATGPVVIDDVIGAALVIGGAKYPFWPGLYPSLGDGYWLILLYPPTAPGPAALLAFSALMRFQRRKASAIIIRPPAPTPMPTPAFAPVERVLPPSSLTSSELAPSEFVSVAAGALEAEVVDVGSGVGEGVADDDEAEGLGSTLNLAEEISWLLVPQAASAGRKRNVHSVEASTSESSRLIAHS